MKFAAVFAIAAASEWVTKGVTHSTHEQGNGVGNNHVVLKNAAGFHLKLEGDLYLRVGVWVSGLFEQ